MLLYLLIAGCIFSLCNLFCFFFILLVELISALLRGFVNLLSLDFLMGVVYIGFEGSWVGSTPKRFLMVTRWRENLSSGENLAGCADLVTVPSAVSFLRV